MTTDVKARRTHRSQIVAIPPTRTSLGVSLAGTVGNHEGWRRVANQKPESRVLLRCYVRSLLYADVGAARAELSRHVDRIVMRPAEVEGKRCYVASGEWSLLGKGKGPLTSTAQSNLEMVAGACNALKTPTCHFEFAPLEAAWRGVDRRTS